ncbi:MAG: sulfotransferase [Actinomycetota bacterium]
MPDVKVLYIVAWGRSGSTILGNLLGELDGFFHAGELRTIWGKGLLRGRLCGCGVPVAECEIWSAVIGQALDDGNSRPLDPETVHRWQSEAVRLRHTSRLLRTAPGRPSGRPSLDSYLRVAARLYGAISRVTSSRVVVDSSKRPADAALLSLLPGISPSFVHLVRDPRAVAYSWQRKKASPGEGHDEEMLRYSTLTSACSWTASNLAAEAVRRRRGRGRSMMVRYEDFVLRPRATVEEILRMVDQGPTDLPFAGERTVRLTRNHTAGGNPDRFSAGPIELRLDDEWVTGQRRTDRLLVSVLSLPLLSRYGYPVRPRAQSRSAIPASDAG